MHANFIRYVGLHHVINHWEGEECQPHPTQKWQLKIKTGHMTEIMEHHLQQQIVTPSSKRNFKTVAKCCWFGMKYEFYSDFFFCTCLFMLEGSGILLFKIAQILQLINLSVFFLICSMYQNLKKKKWATMVLRASNMKIIKLFSSLGVSLYQSSIGYRLIYNLPLPIFGFFWFVFDQFCQLLSLEFVCRVLYKRNWESDRRSPQVFPLRFLGLISSYIFTYRLVTWQNLESFMKLAKILQHAMFVNWTQAGRAIVNWTLAGRANVPVDVKSLATFLS